MICRALCMNFFYHMVTSGSACISLEEEIENKKIHKKLIRMDFIDEDLLRCSFFGGLLRPEKRLYVVA